MTSILEYYSKYLNDPETRYFILDTKGKGQGHGDVDYSSYDWSPSKYNRVRSGDLFIYRRPGSGSELRGQFYFFGAGVIEEINQIGEDRLRGKISLPSAFRTKLFKRTP